MSNYSKDITSNAVMAVEIESTYARFCKANGCDARTENFQFIAGDSGGYIAGFVVHLGDGRKFRVLVDKA